MHNYQVGDILIASNTGIIYTITKLYLNRFDGSGGSMDITWVLPNGRIDIGNTNISNPRLKPYLQAIEDGKVTYK